jgi:iron(III) transport system ATP-binding protein
VAFGLKGQPAAQVQARVQEMLALVGLGAQAQRYPAQLSGGQQQRIALARALAPRPRLLLLDEPLSALDAQVRTELRSEIRQLQRQLGIACVMVTHDQEEALSMADRVVLMHQGRIEQQGSPEQLYASRSATLRPVLWGA